MPPHLPHQPGQTLFQINSFYGSFCQLMLHTLPIICQHSVSENDKKAPDLVIAMIKMTLSFQANSKRLYYFFTGACWNPVGF